LRWKAARMVRPAEARAENDSVCSWPTLKDNFG